ncbi:4Fe-4S dicluster domain-containing protein [Desulfosporosinus fructosivorans]|uniref:4Fe-4S dicluster domain-containing protein n=1 Tax=Desulfosporosinus fructosivorans TaxID=2018669 RepID=A0A4Z0QXM5_9FIRM|nr:mercury methylation ferredoxin HgcB [Desulfosporosinus fructosivorans]TGE35551.1 4Fe-4S dicluster domain-containing protein [Desulfosporosinus fructosivorans]
MKNLYLKNVATLKLKSELCTGCGKCLEVCPHNVFLIKDRKSVIIDKDRCMECGACAKNCSFKAIEVKQGVGCAFAIIMGWLTGTEPNCDCSGSSGGSCC